MIQAMFSKLGNVDVTEAMKTRRLTGEQLLFRQRRNEELLKRQKAKEEAEEEAKQAEEEARAYTGKLI